MTLLQAQHLLIIEDNPGDVLLVEAMLEETESPPRLTHKLDLRSALAYLERETPDLILLDMGLPDARGTEGIPRLRGVYDGPILMLTGLDDEQRAHAALQEGAQDYLVKDEINPRTLARALGYAIERHRFDQRLRAAEAAQQQLQRELETERQLTRYLTALSHEFRTPLAIIQASVDNLHRMDAAGLERRSERIGIATGRMLQLVEYLVALVRMNSEYSERGAVRAIVVFNELRDAFLNARLTFETSPDLMLPLAHKHLSALLRPLIDNALRYSAPDAPVTIEAKSVGDAVQISICDQGVGIPQDKLVDVFAPFYKVNHARTRQSNEGPGVGLTLARALAQLGGADLSLHSEPGAGTTAIVRIPVTEPMMVTTA